MVFQLKCNPEQEEIQCYFAQGWVCDTVIHGAEWFGGSGVVGVYVNEQIKPDFKPNTWICENHMSALIPAANIKAMQIFLIRRAEMPSTAK